MPGPVVGGLDSPVQFLRGVGPRRARLFENLGMRTLSDVLYHLPRAWEDRKETPPGPAPSDGPVVVCGRVRKSGLRRAGPQLGVFAAELQVPGHGAIDAIWFKRLSHRYDVFQRLRRDVLPGRDLWIVGRAETGLLPVREVSVEEYYAQDDPYRALHVGRLTPQYPLTEGLPARLLREAVAQSLEAGGSSLREILPESLLARRGLLALPQALHGIHFPGSLAELEECRRRLAYEELLFIELAWTLKHRQSREIDKGYSYEVRKNLLTPFKEGLGFELTRAQRRVINEILDDMRAKPPMTRLLQGDVGSGKTVVALAAILLAVENSFQGAFMAPTEILAEQHYWTFSRILRELPVRTALLTSRVAPAARARILAQVARGEVDILIGTHALLEGDVLFPRLRLAVIDEQHRFGVRQRATLRQKGPPMDLLLMTATPIPRTLSLALYGDLDVSTLDELPPGRSPVKTGHVPEEEAFEAVRQQVLRGRQAYVVYPIIEESAALDLKAALAEFERLQTQVFPGLRVGLAHGRMPSKKKVAAMEEFAAGRCDVLVATPVIEVGVDVPNATVMVVQNAERFGLASLHQLRGRIGRGSEASACFLVGEPKTLEARRRISILCETNDGFRIGEEDLKLRGPGEVLGTAQHGDLGLRAADLARDAELLLAARADAELLLGADPRLVEPGHAAIRERLVAQYQRKWESIDLA